MFYHVLMWLCNMRNVKFLIAEGGGKDNLYTKSGTIVSNGYNRIVKGQRGAYVEFTDSQILLKSFHIPKNQLYRLTDLRIYYIEMRSTDASNAKLYYQKKTVAYADYKIGMFYVSPNDLYLEDKRCILEKITKINEKNSEFFE